MKSGKSNIIIVLLSEVDRHLLQVLKQELERTFNVTVEIRTRIRPLAPAYDSIRRQYISPYLLSRLRRMKRSARDKLLGIVDVDLYSPGFEFIYGEAEHASGVATVSLHRLRPEYSGLPPDEKLLAQRFVKEAVHELGHLYGRGHCPNPECVMCSSTSIIEVDIKGNHVCTMPQHDLQV